MPFTRRRRRGYNSSGGGGGPVTVIADNFNRTTTTDIGTASDGGTYTGFTTYFNCDGTKLINNQASAFYGVRRNAGSGNFTSIITISLIASAKTLFRWRMTADGGDYLALATSDATHYFITKHTAASGDVNSFAETIPIANGDVLKIVCSGNNSAIYVNNVLILTHVDAETAGNTWLGPYVAASSLAAGSHAWEDWTVTVP